MKTSTHFPPALHYKLNIALETLLLIPWPHETKYLNKMVVELISLVYYLYCLECWIEWHSTVTSPWPNNQELYWF